MIQRSTLVSTVLLGLSSSLLGGAAQAQEVTFAFSGTIDQVFPQGTLPETVEEGDLLTGRFTFDSQAPGNFGGAGTQLYFAVCRVEAEVDDLVFEGIADPEGSLGGIFARDEAEGAGQDNYFVTFQPEGEISSFVLNLLAPQGTDAFVGTDLPTVPPDPALFETGSRTILVSLGQEFDFAQLSVGDAENFGDLTLAQNPLPCPEPGLSISLGTCVVVLAVRARRRRR